VRHTNTSAIEVLDVRRGRRSVIRRSVDPQTDDLDIDGFAFAGGRALVATRPPCSFSGCSDVRWTGSVRDRRLRQVGPWTSFEHEDVDAPRGFPLAGDGPTLVYYAYCPGGDDCQGGRPVNAIRRVAGRRDFKVIDSIAPTGLAVARGRVALAEPTTPRIGRYSPAWSPDGTRIAFIRRQQDLTRRSKWELAESGTGIHALNTTDGGETRISPGAFDSIDWSPHGRLVFVRTPEHRSEIYVADGDGGNERHVTTGFSPAWSPDGTKIAFARVEGDDSVSVYVVGVDGAAPRRLTAGFSPAWSPDGTRVAVAQDDGISLVDAHSSAATPLPGVTRPVNDLDWSPDGLKIAYEADVNDNPTIFIVAIDGRSGRRLSAAGVSSTSPRWSPDGSRIAFARGAPYVAQLYVMNSDGSGVRQLASPPTRTSRVSVIEAARRKLATRFVVTGDVEALVLSHSRVAILVRREGRRRIELRVARNGALTRSVPVPRSISPSISIADRALVFGVGRVIHLLDGVTGRTSAIGSAASRPIGLSIEGKRVAWAENVRGRGRIRAIMLAR